MQILLQHIEKWVPLVDWEGHLPLMPHGLLGLWSILKVRPIMVEADFQRALHQQMEALSLEGVLENPINFPKPMRTFDALMDEVAPDMANVGHKAVMLRCLNELHALFQPDHDLFLELATWIAQTQPVDTYWHKRASRRLASWRDTVPDLPPALPPSEWKAAAQEICELDMLPMMNAFTARMKTGATRGDLLSALTLAACVKQVCSGAGLAAKASWNFAYLAALTGRLGNSREAFVQAAAMINFFPSPEGALDQLWQHAGSQNGTITHENHGLILPLLPLLPSAKSHPQGRHHAIIALGSVVDLMAHLPKEISQTIIQAHEHFLLSAIFQSASCTIL